MHQNVLNSIINFQKFSGGFIPRFHPLGFFNFFSRSTAKPMEKKKEYEAGKN